MLKPYWKPEKNAGKFWRSVYSHYSDSGQPDIESLRRILVPYDSTLQPVLEDEAVQSARRWIDQGRQELDFNDRLWRVHGSELEEELRRSMDGKIMSEEWIGGDYRALLYFVLINSPRNRIWNILVRLAESDAVLCNSLRAWVEEPLSIIHFTWAGNEWNHDKLLYEAVHDPDLPRYKAAPLVVRAVAYHYSSVDKLRLFAAMAHKAFSVDPNACRGLTIVEFLLLGDAFKSNAVDLHVKTTKPARMPDIREITIIKGPGLMKPWRVQLAQSWCLQLNDICSAMMADFVSEIAVARQHRSGVRTLQCVECGQLFDADIYSRGRTYCSQPCKNRAAKRRQRKKHSEQ